MPVIEFEHGFEEDVPHHPAQVAGFDVGCRAMEGCCARSSSGRHMGHATHDARSDKQKRHSGSF